MNPRTTIAALAATLAALVLVGCGSDSTRIIQSSEGSGISVTGRGEVVAEPDTGYFNVGVDVTAKTVEQAREEAATALEDVISSLKDDGVDDEDLKTTSFSIQPEYNYRNNEEPRIVGFRVSNTLSVTVRDLDRFSETLDGAITAGGDAVRVHGIRFDRDDKSGLIEQARELAMEDARIKGEQLADLGDVDLGAPLSITESSSSTTPPIYYDERAAAGADFADTPIEPGTTSVVVNVSVRWGIDN